ncbi:helicase-related protein [Achromobacter marplatensis]|uniref:helicase-related protein n=1 Tax=Achromobacter marplatensis TaxID=470868 RepID=UPI0028E25D46|nr:helicase-related protein [Achromobacter marplatensis]
MRKSSHGRSAQRRCLSNGWVGFPLGDKAIYVLTQERVNDRQDIKDIDIFVLDEFYKLAFERLRNGDRREDDGRVAALNSALSKLLKCSKQFFLTGPFINGVRGLRNIGRKYTFVPTDYNTVALNIEYRDLKAMDFDGKDSAMLQILQRHKGQTIIYCRSPLAASSIVNTLIKSGIGRDQRDDFTDWLSKHYHEDWDFTKAYAHGIGMHYGGLPRAIQQHTIDRFNSGDLGYLVCTSTIIEGVNTVAKNVIIYDNRNGQFGIDRLTHGNIRGRAGRMGKHFVGNVFCLEALPDGDEIFEVEVPLGQQDQETPINFLAGLQPEHLTDESQARFDAATSQSQVGAELVRKHSSFKFESLEYGYEFVQSLSYDHLTSCLFNGMPNPGFAAIFTEFLFHVSVPSLRSLQLINSQEVVKAKINSYLFAKSYGEYLRDQLDRVTPTEGDEHSRSKKINEELKIANRLFAYTVPKALSLLEDLVTEVARKKNRLQDVSYSHIRSAFENYHLSAAWAGVEEMGVPVQTLQKLNQQFRFDGEANVDTAIDVLCRQVNILKGFQGIERQFIERAIAPTLKARAARLTSGSHG